MAAELSRRLGWLNDADVARIRRIHEAAGLALRGPKMGVERYLELMSHDKKVEAGKLRLVLLKRIGEATVFGDAPVADIAASIERCCGDA